MLEALYAISLACRDHSSLHNILTAIHHELGRMFVFDACFIALCTPDQHDVFRHALNGKGDQVEYTEYVPSGDLTSRMIRQRQPLLFHDLFHDHEAASYATQSPTQAAPNTRSWLGTPLIFSRDVIGVIVLQSNHARRYTAGDRDLLLRMGNIIAATLNHVNLIQYQYEINAALHQQITDRTAELTALSAISAEMVRQQPLPILIDHALHLIIDLLSLDGGNVRLLDENQTTLLLMAHRGMTEEYARLTGRSPMAASPIRSVISANRPLVITSGLHRLPGRDVLPTFEALLSVPLRIGNQAAGTLSLFSIQPRDFTQQEVDLAQAISNQIAIAVENARLFEERERRISELQALTSLSAAAVSAQDFQTLLRQVHDALQVFLRIDAFSMVIYDPGREVITNGLSINEGKEYIYWRNKPPPTGSLTAWIIQHRQILHFDNLPDEISRKPDLERHIVDSERPALSWLGVPLLNHDGNVLGMIAIQSYTPAVFSQRDQSFMIDLSRPLAIHVHNLRLLTQRERQIRELDAIGQIGQLVTASFDLEDMLNGAYETLKQATGAPVCFILILDAETHAITHAISFEQNQRLELDWYGRAPQPGSLSDWILRQREPILFQDLPNQSDQLTARGITPYRVGPPNPVRSWVGVPLLAKGGDPIGILSLQDYRSYAYDEQTIDFLIQIASHVSLGVQKVYLFDERERQVAENARLFVEARSHAESAERQTQRMELVQRISSLLSSTLNQQEILNLAAHELVRLFWADHTGAMMFNDSSQVGVVVAEYPHSGALHMQAPLTNNLLVDELIASRRPVCITSIDTDPRARASLDNFKQLGIASLMIVPLITRDRIIGSISLDSIGKPRIFTEDEQELVLTVAAAIATSIENARLFEAEQEARRTADALREMVRVLSTSFDPNEVLRLILSELHNVISYDTASIMLMDGDRLRIASCRGWPLEQEPCGESLLIERSAAGHVVTLRQPIVTASVDTLSFWNPSLLGGHIHSWLGVPLIARGQVLGVLNIDSHTPNRFSERDVEVALTFASHAALALENARLYQESVTRVEQEMEIARQIQLNLFPKALPQFTGVEIAAKCRPARETGGDFYDLLDLNDQRIGIIVGDVSGKSIPAAMLMAVARSVARSEARDHATPQIVMCETNRLIAHDIPPRMFVALSYAILDLTERRLSLSNAGQVAPLHRRADGRVDYLEAPGSTLPLGIVTDVDYEVAEISLESGDTLVFYTDGIVEAKDRTKQLFGFEWLEELVRTHGDAPPREFIDLVLQTVDHFADDAPQHDDITLLVMRIV